ncbi:ice-binding family protein [Flavobacterium sp. LB2R40]|uniref:ice-binding family protein n=1 Tax=unclassified Flavobacterium TaxID=196869 RepID=UPI003AACE7F6
MKNNIRYVLTLFLLISKIASAQVGIGTINPDISSILDIQSSNKGFLMPRLTTLQRDAISSPAAGLLIYNKTTSSFNFYNLGWQDFATGLVLPINGGTGISNDNSSTLALPGMFATTIRTTSTTDVTLPTTGVLYGTEAVSITSAQILNSLNDETGSRKLVFSESPTFTGIPTAVTAVLGTNTTQLATTAFVLTNSPSIYQSVDGTGDITTRSSTDIVVPGMSISPQAGTYAVSFNAEYKLIAGNKTTQAATDLNFFYNQLVAISATNIDHGAAFGSETLFPGIYSTPAAGSASGILILDGRGDSNALFIFKFGAAFNTVAGTKIVLINGASATNIFWIAEGAIGLGASTKMKGTLLSKSGAVAVGADCIVNGRLLSGFGSIGIDGSTITKTFDSSYANLGALSSFAVFTSSGEVGNSGFSDITGDIGTHSGAITGFEGSNVMGGFFTPTVSSAYASFSVYQNDILITNSTRFRLSTVNTADITLQAIATVSSGQSIDIRWSVDTGLIKLGNRILTIINVR